MRCAGWPSGWAGGRGGRPTPRRSYREAAAAGDPHALRELVEWLGGGRGGRPTPRQVCREAAAAGDPYALRALVEWLGRRPGREVDAEEVYREAAAAGHPDALYELGQVATRARATDRGRPDTPLWHRCARPHSRGGSSLTNNRRAEPRILAESAEPRSSQKPVAPHPSQDSATGQRLASENMGRTSGRGGRGRGAELLSGPRRRRLSSTSEGAKRLRVGPGQGMLPSGSSPCVCRRSATAGCCLVSTSRRHLTAP